MEGKRWRSGEWRDGEVEGWRDGGWRDGEVGRSTYDAPEIWFFDKHKEIPFNFLPSWTRG